MITKNKLRASTDALNNAVSSRIAGKRTRVYYVIEQADWSIRWDGHYITRAVQREAGIRGGTTLTARGIANQVVHFGSRNLMMTSHLPPRLASVHPSNKIVFSWFNGRSDSIGSDEARFNELLPDAIERADLIVTSSSAGADRLRQAGAPDSKLRMLPLGVDLGIFTPVTQDRKRELRRSLGISDDAFCVGSFQKDGDGWGAGMSPKIVKGPDVFADVVEKLSRSLPIHVLLAGPARGYLIRRLETMRVKFTYLDHVKHTEMPPHYQSLDLYIVSSRDEGGPKAILESMATGIPLVTTRVGMAADILTSGTNAFVTDVDDVDGLVAAAGRLATDRELRTSIAAAGLVTAQKFDWAAIGRRYADEVYRPLMKATE